MLQTAQTNKHQENIELIAALHLQFVIEVYALNTFLLSRTYIPCRDIVEIRSGVDAHHLRKSHTADSTKCAALFSSQLCIEMEFDSSSQRNKFVTYCRKICTYCRGGRA